ncbi:hypothetical protein Bca4012_058159 [Brassica carinata]
MSLAPPYTYSYLPDLLQKLRQSVEKRNIQKVLYPPELVEQLKNKDDQIKALENENAMMLAELAESQRLMAEKKEKLGNNVL